MTMAERIVCRLVSGNPESFMDRLPNRPDWQADVHYVEASLYAAYQRGGNHEPMEELDGEEKDHLGRAHL